MVVMVVLMMVVVVVVMMLVVVVVVVMMMVMVVVVDQWLQSDTICIFTEGKVLHSRGWLRKCLSNQNDMTCMQNMKLWKENFSNQFVKKVDKLLGILEQK